MKGDGSLVDIGGRIQVLSGFAFPSTGFHESEGVPLIRIRDLSKGRTEVRFRGKYDAVFEVRAGDVLVGMDGDFSAVRWSGGLALLNQRVCKVAPKADCDLDDGYLYHSLQPQLDAIHRRTPQTTVRHLSGGDIYGIRLPLPPLPEQQLIASILDTVDEVIRKTEEVIAKLQQMKQGLLHDLLTRGIDDNGELRDPDRHPEQFKDSELGRIPKEWEVEGFRRLCESSAFGPRFSAEYYTSSGNVGTLRTTDLDNEGNIDFRTVPFAALPLAMTRDHLLQPNDLTISRSGTCGIVSIFPGFPKPIIPGAFLIRFRLFDPGMARFFRRYFNSSLGRPRLEQLSVGGVQKNLKGSSVLALRVPLPKAEEAERIEKNLAGVESSIHTEQAELSKLRLLKSGLMDDLLTGRVRVTDLLPTTTTP